MYKSIWQSFYQVSLLLQHGLSHSVLLRAFPHFNPAVMLYVRAKLRNDSGNSLLGSLHEVSGLLLLVNLLLSFLLLEQMLL